MIQTNKQSGFTAVELLITLFVAAGFLVASYQLYNLIIKDGGATRAESRASNVAYDYLRQYAASSTTIPCTASTPLMAAPLTIDGLTSASISITISCLPDAINSLSKIEAAITYNNPPQTVKYATYVSSSNNFTTTGTPNHLAASIIMVSRSLHPVDHSHQLAPPDSQRTASLTARWTVFASTAGQYLKLKLPDSIRQEQNNEAY